MPDDTNGHFERRTFLKATGAASAAAALGVSNVTAGRGQSAAEAENEIVVNVAGAADFETAKRKAAEKFDGEVVHANEKLSYLVVEQQERTVQTLGTVQTQAAAEPEFRSVEENAVYEAHQVNDPRLDDQYAPQQTNAVDVWDDGFLGDKDVSIAIIDTGTDYEHETLESRYDGNVGTDVAGGDSDPSPPRGEQHGSHVSGIAAATTDNGTGVAGQANAQLYSVRVLGGGRGSLTDIADGIQWAADQGVDIINMSLGGGGRRDLMKNAVSNAYNAGVTIFASAGNSGRRGVAYPSGYDECISVSAVDDSENLASFSQFGEKIEVTAPGVDVLSTLPNNSYGRFSGTSMSSPAAAGVAALGKAAQKDISNSELRAAIKETARDIGLSSDEQGAGHVDAKALVDRLGGGGEEPPEEPPECGSETGGGSAQGSFGFFNRSDSYTYTAETSDPCQIEFTLSGPRNVDFDLIVSSGGQEARPGTPGANEQVIAQDPEAGQEFEITIEAVSGFGDYTIEVEEIGA